MYMQLNNLTQKKARHEGCSPLRLSQRTRLNDGGTGTPAECSTAMIKVKITPVLFPVMANQNVRCKTLRIRFLCYEEA